MTRLIHISVRIPYELDRWLQLAEETLRRPRSEVIRRALELGARELVRREWGEGGKELER